MPLPARIKHNACNTYAIRFAGSRLPGKRKAIVSAAICAARYVTGGPVRVCTNTYRALGALPNEAQAFNLRFFLTACERHSPSARYG